jgi:hypothetical protein
MFLVWALCMCIYIYISFRKRNRYDWTRFRALSRLDKKFDDALTRYYKAFCAMCKRACGLKFTEEEGEQKECYISKDY